jgi:hypothetical protein
MNRRAIAWILFVSVGVYCLVISLLGRVAFAYGYRPEAHNTIMFIRYLQPVLVLPFFLLAVVPRKWATFPLWVLCVSIASFPFLIRDAQLKMLLGYWNVPFGVRAVKELAIVMVIPVVVQLAAWLRSGSEKQGPKDQLQSPISHA